MINIVSTSDSPEQVAAAMGVAAPEAEPVATETTPPADTTAAAAGTEPAATTPAEVPDNDDDLPDDDEAPDAAAASEAGRTLAKHRGAKARIGQLRAKLTATNTENEELKRKLAELSTKPAVETPPVAAIPVPPAAVTPPAVVTQPATEFETPRPKQEDFDDFDAYLEAREKWVEDKANWNTERRIAAIEANRAEEIRQAEENARQQAATERRNQAVTKKVETARAKYADFDEVLKRAESIVLSNVVLQYLEEQDNGVELSYHLASDPDLSQSISTMTPAQALVALGRLETRIAAGEPSTPPAATEPPASEPAKPAAQIPVSSAPAPMRRVGGGATPVAKDPSKMTHAEYKEWRANGGGR